MGVCRRVLALQRVASSRSDARRARLVRILACATFAVAPWGAVLLVGQDLRADVAESSIGDAGPCPAHPSPCAIAVRAPFVMHSDCDVMQRPYGNADDGGLGGCAIAIRQRPPAGRDDVEVSVGIGLFTDSSGALDFVGRASVQRSRVEWVAITHVQGSMHLDLTNRCADGTIHGTLRATLPVSNIAKGYEPPPVRLVAQF
jgi:hypothetical protein